MYINKQMRTWEVEYISMLLKELVWSVLCQGIVSVMHSNRGSEPLMSMGQREADTIKNWISNANIFNAVWLHFLYFQSFYILNWTWPFLKDLNGF